MQQHLVCDYYSRKIMVLDTEYETNPKRLLSLAYFLYSFEDNKWNKTGSVYYVKYDIRYTISNIKYIIYYLCYI